ncbi:hypothetical protein SAMN06265373_11341 [Shimia sagamensis]|uniref:Uncharacterized protein n=1 Tax=Shimia sagamensis TaxID=1566352 RepID=A0ABY1PLM1_9RHOB|nr:hypothetical protein SAMN06265373_11341 [Shimia sagamensis]
MASWTWAPLALAEEELEAFYTFTDLPDVIQRLVDQGWEVQQIDRQLHYKCLTCETEVEAFLSVTPLPTADLLEHSNTYRDRFKRYCADLIISASGRCVRTTPFRVRGHAHPGLKSEIIVGAKRYVRQAIFSKSLHSGPVQITSEVWTDKNSEIPIGISQTLASHMLRFTPWW